jgi:hypothetical protein
MGMYIKRKSQAQEKRTASQFGGRPQIASGAIDGMKSDVRTGDTTVGFKQSDFLIENKFTDDTRYILHLATWTKVEKEALRDNLRTPLMQIDIGRDVKIVVLDENDFLAFGGEWENKYTTPIKGKSISIKEKDIHNLLDVYKPVWKLAFVNSKKNLVVIQLSDFLNAIAT